MLNITSRLRRHSKQLLLRVLCLLPACIPQQSACYAGQAWTSPATGQAWTRCGPARRTPSLRSPAPCSACPLGPGWTPSERTPLRATCPAARPLACLAAPHPSSKASGWTTLRPTAVMGSRQIRSALTTQAPAWQSSLQCTAVQLAAEMCSTASVCAWGSRQDD